MGNRIPAWLERGMKEHAARYPSPPPLEATLNVTIEPPTTITARVKASHLRAVRELFKGKSDDEIVQTMFAAVIERFGLKP